MEQSAANGEIIAALISIQITPRDTELTIESRKSTVLNAMTNLPVWEDRGWIGVPMTSRGPLRALAAALKSRTAKTTVAVVGGQARTERAAEKSVEATQKATPDEVNTIVSAEADLAGTKLSKITQAVAYRGIKDLRAPVSRKATDENIMAIQAALKQNFGHAIKPSVIWKSIRDKDIGRQIRNFLWKCIYNAIKSGNTGNTSLNVRKELYAKLATAQRALSISCWSARDPVNLRSGNWQRSSGYGNNQPGPTCHLARYSQCSLGVFIDQRNKLNTSTVRLYRILISESAHLIWKLRCECVIGCDGEPPTIKEVQNRWSKIMNERLEIDINLMNCLRYGNEYSIDPL
jgi:ribonuclease HI